MKNKYDPAAAIQQLEQFGEFGGVNPSITDSATYTFLDEQTMIDAFHGEAAGCFLYSRHWNPSNKYLSDTLAAMEGTEAAWVTASGMSAITTTILQLVNSGDHIITSVTTYGGTYAFFANYLKKFNIDVTFVNISDLKSVEKAVKPNTKLIYTESMTNPMLQVSNIPELGKIAKENGLKLVVDNTFTPMILSPFILGADIVVYSMTKFINGKNDAIAGAICASQDFINDISNVNDGTAMLLGPVLDPLRSSSILKNIGSLHIRMQKHSENAMYLAREFKKVGLKFNYPGMPEHSEHKLMESIMNEEYGYGGMIAIDLGTPEKARQLMEMMQERKVGYHAVSLGYFKTLFSNSGRSTSSEVPQEIQDEMGLSAGLIRFSVGLDHDIKATYKTIKSCLEDLHLI
jgi:methionine-gamma-lyase